MTKKTVLEIVYDDDSSVEIELASDGSLTVGEGIKVGTMGTRRDVLRILDIVDRFLNGNGIKELNFEEEEE